MLDKVILVLILDPFKPEEVIRTVVEADGTPVIDLIPKDLVLPDTDLTVFVNDSYIDDINYVPDKNDVIIIHAKVKDVFSSVAYFVANFVGEMIVGWESATAIWAVYDAVYYATYLLTLYAVNSVLIKSVVGTPDIPGLPSGDSANPTYHWGAPTNTRDQGTPIAYLFGRHRIAGHILNQFVEVGDGNKEYLNIMIGICIGPIDSVESVEINGQPSTYFRGVETYVDRLGTLSDEPIPHFDQLVSQQSFSTKLLYNTPVIYQTDGNQVQRAELDIVAPGGLSYANGDGTLSGRSVDIRVRYREVGSTTWINYGWDQFSVLVASDPIMNTASVWNAPTDYSNLNFGSNDINVVGVNDVQRGKIAIDNLEPGQYEFEVTRLTADSDSPRLRDEIHFIGMREIVKYELIYPGIAKYAVRALATDQLSGSTPTFTCIATRSIVSVFNNSTQEWEHKRATNPAWATYEVLVNKGPVKPSKINFAEWLSWASYCDELVNGKYRFSINYVVDKLANSWDSAQRIAKLGRAVIVRRGSSFTPIVDKPIANRSHVFSPVNIKPESLSVQYLNLKDRANAMELSFMDEDRLFERQTVFIYNDEYTDVTKPAKVVSVSLDGYTDIDLVVADGFFALNCNNFLREVISFEALLDSFDCALGDKFGFSHPILMPDSSVSGRLVSCRNDDTYGYITIDRSYYLDNTKSYIISVVSLDGTITDKTVLVNTSGNATELKLTTKWSSLPNDKCHFILGELGSQLREYKMVGLTRGDTFHRRVTGVEYRPELWSTENYTVTKPDYLSQPQAAVNVMAYEFLTYSNDGSLSSNILVNWQPTSRVGTSWNVWLENTGAADGIVRNIGTSNSLSFTITAQFVTVGNQYKVYVSPANSGLTDTSNTTTIELVGKLAPPSNISGMSAVWDVSNKRVVLTWSEVLDLDLDYYELRLGATWETAEVISKAIREPRFYYKVPYGTNEELKFWLKAVDTSKKYSTQGSFATVVVNTDACPLLQPAGLTLKTTCETYVDGSQKVSIYASWDDNAKINALFSHYEVVIIDVDAAITWSASAITRDEIYSWAVIPNHTFTVKVRAVDRDSNYTTYASQSLLAASDSVKPSTVVWSGDIYAGLKLAKLSWSRNPEYDIAYYIVERSSTGNFTGEQSIIARPTSNHLIDSTVVAGQQYWYRIKAIDTSNNQSNNWSTIKSCVPLAVNHDDIAAEAVRASHMSTTDLFAIKVQSLDFVTGESGFSLNSQTGVSEIHGAMVVMGAGSVIPAGTDVGGVTLPSNPSFTDTIARVFKQQPAPPYDVDDMWLSGTSLLICDVARDGVTNGQTSFNSADWRVISTNNSAWASSNDPNKLNGGIIDAATGLLNHPLVFTNESRRAVKIENGNIYIIYRLDLNNPALDVEYNSLKRYEFGTAQNGVQARIPGYFASAPNIIVYPNNLKSFDPAYNASSQFFKMQALGLFESPAGSMEWYFTPRAELVINAGSGSDIISTSGQDSANTVYTPWRRPSGVNTTAVTVVANVRSIHTTTTSGVYKRRKVRSWVEYRPTGGGTVTTESNADGWYELPADTATTYQISNSLTGLTNADREYRLKIEYADQGTTFGATAYEYVSENVTVLQASMTGDTTNNSDESNPAQFNLPAISTYNNVQSRLNAGWSILSVQYTSTVVLLGQSYSGGSFVTWSTQGVDIYDVVYSGGQYNREYLNPRLSFVVTDYNNNITTTATATRDSYLSQFYISAWGDGYAPFDYVYLNSKISQMAMVFNLRRSLAASDTTTNYYTEVRLDFTTGADTVLDSTGIVSYVAIGQ